MALAPVYMHHLPFFERLFGRVTKTPIVVRRCYVRGVCSEAMIEALMNAPSNGPLMTDAANAIVEEVWSGFRRFVLIDLVCAALSLFLVCRATVIVHAGGTAGLGLLTGRWVAQRAHAHNVLRGVQCALPPD